MPERRERPDMPQAEPARGFGRGETEDEQASAGRRGVISDVTASADARGVEFAERTRAAVSKAGQRARQKVQHAGDKEQEQADTGMKTAASQLQDAATKVRERASGQGGVRAEAMTNAADGMEKTAGYLRSKDTAEMLDDLEAYVREHPMQAVGGAALGGFLIGRILR